MQFFFFKSSPNLHNVKQNSLANESLLMYLENSKFKKSWIVKFDSKFNFKFDLHLDCPESEQLCHRLVKYTL